MYTVTIILTRSWEPTTNAVLTLETYSPMDAHTAFQQFQVAMNRWLYLTEQGQQLVEDSKEEFNIGDFLLSEKVITRDPDFKKLMRAEGVRFAAIGTADYRADYDTVLCT